MVLFAIGVRGGPRGFAPKFKNRESYVEDRMNEQNLDLRLSFLLSVSFAVLRAPIWESFWYPMGPFLRSGCAVVHADLRRRAVSR